MLAALRALPVSLCLLALVGAQNLTPSSSWRKPNITTPVSQRIALANAAAQLTVGTYLNKSTEAVKSFSFGTVSHIYGALAQYDAFTQGTTFKNTLETAFQFTQSNGTLEGNLLDFGLNFGVAAARAAKGYNDSSFLDFATDAWQFGNTFTLTAADIASGSHPRKNFTLQATCQQATMVGGTFFQIDEDSTAINALATGGFFVLSGLLYEATNNQTYLTAAQNSYVFIKAHLFSSQNIVQDTIQADTASNCELSSTAFPYNSAWFIEGMSIMLSTTPSADVYNTLVNAVSASAGFRSWTDVQTGIISSGSDNTSDGTGDGNLVRALSQAFQRNTTNVPLRQFLDAYISVQYNAVVDLASLGGDQYSNSWLGHDASTSDSDQYGALEVLVNGIAIGNDTVSSSTSTVSNSASTVTGTQTTDPNSSSSTNVGAIIGGVVAGIVVLALIGIAFFILRRRKLRQKAPKRSMSIASQHTPASRPRATNENGEATAMLGNHSRNDSRDQFIATPFEIPSASTSQHTSNRKAAHTATSGYTTSGDPPWNQAATTSSGPSILDSSHSSSDRPNEKASMLRQSSPRALPALPSPQNQGPSPQQSPPLGISDNTPTEELARMLIQRIRAGETIPNADELEPPPTYHPEHR